MIGNISNPLDRIQRAGGRVLIGSDGIAEINTSLQIHGPRPWFDPTAPPFNADPSGTTNCLTALNDCWAEAQAASGGIILIPRGFYRVEGEVNWKDGNDTLIIGGLGSQIFAPAGVSIGATDGIVNFCGTRYSTIFGLRISGQIVGAGRPGAGLIFGRTAADGSYNNLINVWVDGEFGTAAFYDAGSEILNCISCIFSTNRDAAYAYYTTSNDSVIGLANGSSSVSNTAKTFNNCRFVNDYAGANAINLIGLASVNKEFSFLDCFYAIGNTGIAIVFRLLDSVIPDTGSSMANLVIVGRRVEQNNSVNTGTRLIYNDKTAGMTQLRVSNFGWGSVPNAAYMIEDLRGISDSDIEWRPTGSQKLVNVTSPAAFRQNRVNGRLNASINVNAGASATENTLNMADTGFPLIGAGQLGDGVGRQDNIVVSSAGSDAFVSAPVIRQRIGVFTSTDTTPSVQGLSLWETANASPTSISEFDDGETGQEITVFVKDANTTFVHTVANTVDTLKLLGSVNFASPNGSVHVFRRDERATNIWREVSRVTPVGYTQSVFKAADETISNNTLQDDDHLTLALAASATYNFRFELFYTTTSATAGIQVALGGTVGVAALRAQIGIWDDVTTNALAAFSRVTGLGSAVGVVTPAGDNRIIIEGTITTSTAGTLLLRWAQQVTDAVNATHMQHLSSYRLTRMA